MSREKKPLDKKLVRPIRGERNIRGSLARKYLVTISERCSQLVVITFRQGKRRVDFMATDIEFNGHSKIKK